MASFCLFKAITHLPCLTCGMTRSLLSLLEGRWQDAWQYHPLLPLLLVLVPAGLALHLRWPSLRVSAPLMLGSAGILLLGSWIIKLTGSPRFW